MANQLHGSPRRPAVDQREHVAGEGCEVERPRGRGRRVTAKPGCDDVTSAAAELGKEGLRGGRMVREAVQDDRRLTIGITTLQRVKGAVWQVEGDVFELHMYQPSPRAVGREMLMLASVSGLDMCVSSGAACTAGSAGQSVELADLFVEGKTMDKISLPLG